jgi:hypothetical protein
MYRDPLGAAKERYAQARAEVDQAPAALRHELFEELPARSQAELRELEAASTPASDTVEAFVEAAKSAHAYAAKLHEAADLLAQLKFERDVGLRPARRIGPWLLGAAGLVATGAALWYVPPKLVGYGSEAATECFEEELASGEADWLRCRQRAWLWPAMVFPYTRARARDESAEIDARIATEELVASVRGTLDAARRDASARQILAASESSTSTISAVERAGAFEVLATTDALTQGFADKAFAASLFGANLKRSHDIAESGTTQNDYGQVAYDRRRGAWLCLHGKVDEGVAILSGLSRRGGRHGQNEVRPILVACGSTSAELGFDPRNVFESSARSTVVSLDLAAGWQAGRHAAMVDHDSPLLSLDHIAAFVVTRDRSAKEILRRVAPAGTDYRIDGYSAMLMPREAQRFATVWSVRRARDGVVRADAFEEAARRLEALAASTPAPVGGSEPVVGDSEAHDYELLRIGGEARTDPAAYLRQAAWALELEAAAEWVRRGDSKRALAAAEDAERLAPPLLAWLTGAIRHAAGDPSGAQRVIEAFLASPASRDASPGDLCLARIELALSLAAQDRWADALRVAMKAATWDPVPGGAPIDGGVLESARWLAVALSLREGSDAEVDGVRAPTTPLPWEDVATPDVLATVKNLDLGAWRALALASPDERRRVRARLPSLGTEWPSYPDVMPAVMFVAGQIAADAEANHAGIEVWLDHAFASELLGSRIGGLRVTLLARAEAARWRGDEASARSWADRAAALSKPIEDERTALLAFHAGL